MQELEDCMKSSREYIVFRQRADDADSGWNAHGEELIEYLTRLTGEYPISLLEDPIQRKIGKAYRSWKRNWKIGRIVKKRRYWEDGLL